MDLVKLIQHASSILNLNNTFSLIDSNDQEIKLKTEDGKELKCFIPAALYIGQLSSRKGFTGNTKEEQASVYQWLEYCLLNRNHKENHSTLNELDLFLKDKVYFVGNRFTIVDLLFCLSLHETFSKLTFQEKELYFNLSRWFRQVQNEVCTHELYPKICFAKTKMYT